MSTARREFYISSNGDRWLLVQGEAPGHWRVRHQANAASGGHVTDWPLDAFLAQSEHKPEHKALLRILAGTNTAGVEQWKPVETAPEKTLVLVCGPFGVATAQFNLGQFWAMAGKLEAYTEDGDLLMLEGVTGWTTVPQG